jgi:DNA-binding HxlR family transcriptional regulator
MLIKTLSKKYVYDILAQLDASDKMHFDQLQRATGINSGTLTQLLKELKEEGLVDNIKMRDDKRLKSFYFLTDKGKTALKLLNLIYKLENLEEGSKMTITYSISKDDDTVVSG